MELTVLCRVVDNYGDIGFVYRLSRAMSELCRNRGERLNLNLVVSNLATFAQIAPGVLTGRAVQEYNGWRVFDWNRALECTEYFMRHEPLLILECFQCGRPEWLEGILFRSEKHLTTHIVNVEYLTAESWATEFHLLKSGTRSAMVKKINFMPGFTAGTGGLVLDENFMRCLKSRDYALSLLDDFLDPGLLRSIALRSDFFVTVFTYGRDFSGCVSAMESFSASGRQVHVLLAGALSREGFLSAWKNAGSPFKLTVLPQLTQQAWDALLCCTDFNIVRGEDSFSRACLCGVPFLWHAYPQKDCVHLTKVSALVERAGAFLSEPQRKVYATSMRSFNLSHADCAILNLNPAEQENALRCSLEELLENSAPLKAAFGQFSQSLLSNGNLAEHLMQYIHSVLSA